MTDKGVFTTSARHMKPGKYLTVNGPFSRLCYATKYRFVRAMKHIQGEQNMVYAGMCSGLRGAHFNLVSETGFNPSNGRLPNSASIW